MKNLILIAFLISCFSSFSQTLNIHKMDGSISSVAVSDIDSITFVEISDTSNIISEDSLRLSEVTYTMGDEGNGSISFTYKEDILNMIILKEDYEILRIDSLSLEYSNESLSQILHSSFYHDNFGKSTNDTYESILYEVTYPNNSISIKPRYIPESTHYKTIDINFNNNKTLKKIIKTRHDFYDNKDDISVDLANFIVDKDNIVNLLWDGESIEYSYDQKKNPFRLIPFAALVFSHYINNFFGDEYNIFNCLSKNNCTKLNADYGEYSQTNEYKYYYNKNGYPSMLILDQNYVYRDINEQYDRKEFIYFEYE